MSNQNTKFARSSSAQNKGTVPEEKPEPTNSAHNEHHSEVENHFVNIHFVTKNKIDIPP